MGIALHLSALREELRQVQELSTRAGVDKNNRGIGACFMEIMEK